MLYAVIIGLTAVLMLGAVARYRHAVKMAKLANTRLGDSNLNSYSANGRIK